MIESIDALALNWMLAQQAFDPTNLERVPRTYVSGSFSKVMLISVFLGAIAYWLLQHGVLKNKVMAWIGVAAFGCAALVAWSVVPSEMDSMIRFCFSMLALGGGLAFIVAREPVHAALGFATAVLSSCGVLFMQQAYFVAAATIIVYAGATIIIFLFVLMFAQQTHLKGYDIQLTHPGVAVCIATALLVTIVWSVASEGEILPTKIDVTRKYSLAAQPETPDAEPPMSVLGMSDEQAARFVPSQTSGLGRAMYTDYLMAVELAGTILLVATIGAIALAQKPGEDVT